MQRKITLVIGPSGAGKTRTVSEKIKKIQRVAVFDLVRDGQYFDERDDVTVVDARPRDFALAIAPDKDAYRVIYHPDKSLCKSNDKGLIDSVEFGPVVRICHQRGDMTLVIDEAHLLCNLYNCPPDLMEANLIGRHQGFSMILVAQKLTGLHPAIRENADEIYFWKVISPASLKMIEEMCGKETAEKVADLRAVEVDDDNVFIAAGQRLHWTKFKGVVEVTE